MSRSKVVSSYPSIMLQAMQAAVDRGEFVIPSKSPSALRLHYYGLTGALRAEGKPELPDLVSFHIGKNPPSLIIRMKEEGEMAQEIAAAFALTPSDKPAEFDIDADAALARILGGKS